MTGDRLGDGGSKASGSARGGAGAVQSSKRRQLFAAMAASCRERGYEATSVADLLQISGVSRAGFYAEFSSKLDCFLKMQDAAIDGMLTRIERRMAEVPEEPKRAEPILLALAEAIAEQPATARACMLDAYAAGSEARARLAAMAERIEDLLVAARAAGEAETRGNLPAELARAISSGILKIFQGRLIRGEASELIGLAPRLARWLLTQEAPPEPLRARRTAGPLPFSPAFARRDPVERILRATARCVAERGYHATTVAEIAARGRLSQRTFYEHFAGKEEAAIAAIDSSGAQMLAAALPAIRRADDWPSAVHGAYASLCGFLVAERDFARLRIVETYAAGAKALEVRDQAGQELLSVLLEAAPPAVADKADPMLVEMIAAAAYAHLYVCVSEGCADELPRCVAPLTFLTLSPFLGAEAACEAANGDGRRR